MFKNFILLTILIFSTIGCSHMLGGTCTFETIYGTAKVVEFQGNKPYVLFNPGKQRFSNIKVPFNQQIKFLAAETLEGKIGTIYPAQLAVITKGSCTPYRFTLLSGESFSRGIFIPFAHAGIITDDGKQTLNQFATIFKILSPSWPQLVLNICGQTQREGSEEYNLQLGERYGRTVTRLLQQTGIHSTKIRTKPAGEHLCPGSAYFADETEHGVWLNIWLTGENTPTTTIR